MFAISHWACNVRILYSRGWHYFHHVILHRWRSTYDWQAKAIPQMGRQRNTPSQRTILMCPSHQPLSSPCLNEDSTIWGEGGGGKGELRPKPNGEKLGKEFMKRKMGTIPLLMAHRQIMKVINGERKTRENEELEITKRRDRKSHTEQNLL